MALTFCVSNKMALEEEIIFYSTRRTCLWFDGIWTHQTCMGSRLIDCSLNQVNIEAKEARPRH